MLGLAAKRTLSHATSLASLVLDFVLPPHCPVCLDQIATNGTVCAACFKTLNFITAPLCTACGLPFGSRALAGPLQLCPACLASPPPWGQARAALLYDDATRALILPFKHADRQENAFILGRHMARAGAALFAGAGLLVPVPLHRKRLRARGYNQAALLARALSRRTGLPLAVDALQRLRPTPSLGELSAADRAHALDGAIAARPSRAASLSGRRIVLVDDVLTTGATAGACTRALLDAGAAHIDLVVAARVPGPTS